jgi:hypothetical protein
MTTEPLNDTSKKSRGIYVARLGLDRHAARLATACARSLNQFIVSTGALSGFPRQALRHHRPGFASTFCHVEAH